jgi:hypothetical protein
VGGGRRAVAGARGTWHVATAANRAHPAALLPMPTPRRARRLLAELAGGW